MKIFNRNLYVIALAIMLIGGASACASKPKAATGPEATPSAEAKQAQDAAKATETSAEAKRQQEETARQVEMDQTKAKEAETAKTAAASALAIEKLEKAYFDFDKYEIKKDSRASLEQSAAEIKKFADAKVVVEGHCDERGSEEYNLALGERRAMSVKSYLTSLGVKEGQLHIISYGEEHPDDAGHTENAWARNRRVQFSQE